MNYTFIIGCARSGTSILGELVAAHPDVKYIFEASHIWELGGMGENESHRLTVQHATEPVKKQIREWFEGQAHGTNVIVEKNPRNSLRIPYLKEIFPDAKFIHIVRDGRDVACSMIPGCGGAEWGHLKPPSWQEYYSKYTGAIRCAYAWKQVLDTALDDLTQVPHMQIRYEDLLASPLLVAKSTFNFLNLDFHVNTVEFCKKIVNDTSSSYHAKYQDRWYRNDHRKRIGRWRENLNEKEQETINDLLEPLLTRLGYTDRSDTDHPGLPAPKKKESGEDIDASDKRLIVVLGMHRSGTSTIARGLKTMGVELGYNLMPPVIGNNDAGFWEDQDINELNIQMLSLLNMDWHFLAPIQAFHTDILREHGYIKRALELLRKKTDGVRIFGFKDPRTSKLLPFWKEVFAQSQLDVSYVISLRNPLSVCQSLAKRDGIDIEKSAILWLDHVLGSLSGTIGEKCVLVDYDHLMQSPDEELRRVANILQLQVNLLELKKFKTEFLDDNLRHTVFHVDDLLSEDKIPPLAREVYTDLSRIKTNDEGLDTTNIKNRIKLWQNDFLRQKSALILVDRLTSKLIAKDQLLFNKDQLLFNKENENRFLSDKINEILQSRSWKLIQFLQQFRLKILPSGSRQERVAQIIWRGWLMLRSQGLRFFLYQTIERVTGRTFWYNHIRNTRRKNLRKGRRGFKSIRGLPHVLREKVGQIEDLAIFDYDWYLNDNPAVFHTGINPVEHYLLHGIRDERPPTPLFNTSIYSKAFGVAKEDALIHFAQSGRLFAPGAYRTAEVLITAQQQYREGLSMECVKDNRTKPQKYAVYFQCGAGSIHEQWMKDSDKNWDLIVNHYDTTHLGKIYCDIEFIQTGTQPGTKFTSVDNLLSNRPDILAPYRYIMFLDDDILLNERDIDYLFAIADEKRLDCAQASLSPDSFCAHPVCKNAGNGIRYVNAVEIMMPILSQNTLKLGGHLFNQTISGWGLDVAISKFVGYQGKTAVIDDVVARHTKAINLEEGAFYKMLHRAYIYPEIELTHLQRIYGLGRSLYKVAPGFTKHIWSKIQ